MRNAGVKILEANLFRYRGNYLSRLDKNFSQQPVLDWAKTFFFVLLSLSSELQRDSLKAFFLSLLSSYPQDSWPAFFGLLLRQQKGLIHSLKSGSNSQLKAQGFPLESSFLSFFVAERLIDLSSQTVLLHQNVFRFIVAWPNVVMPVEFVKGFFSSENAVNRFLLGAGLFQIRCATTAYTLSSSFLFPIIIYQCKINHL